MTFDRRLAVASNRPPISDREFHRADQNRSIALNIDHLRGLR